MSGVETALAAMLNGTYVEPETVDNGDHDFNEGGLQDVVGLSPSGTMGELSKLLTPSKVVKPQDTSMLEIETYIKDGVEHMRALDGSFDTGK